MKVRSRFAKNDVKAIVFRLAEESGEWDVDAIYRSLSIKQLTDWLGYWKWKAAMLDQMKQQEEMKK